MRRSRKSLQIGLLLVIGAFIATSVFVYGAGTLRGDGGDAVAKVNGEAIPLARYQRRYQEYVNAYAQMMRDRFSPELAERLGLSQQVVEDLVQETLIVQRARAEGLETNDEELNAQIHAIPAFKENDRFSLRRYEDVLRRSGVTKAAFEQDIRRRLTRMKVEHAVRSGVKVSDGEVEQAFAHNREEVRAAWALVETGPLIAIQTATDAELEAYLKDHAAEFREPERRKIQYVTLSPRDFVRPVTEAEVARYYGEHASEFETPRQASAAHILVRVPETGGSEAEDKARAKVADVIRRAKGGEDFAKLAKEISEDPGSASKGGDLGLVRKGEMVPAFEQALFALKPGEVSPEPVRTPFGFHAIKVFETREGGRKPLKEVATQIRDRLQAEVSEQAAKAKADEVRAKLLSAPDFMGEAKKLGLSPVESTIARRESPPGLAPPDPIQETAFSLAKGGVSVPVKIPAGHIVLKTIEELPAAVPPLAEIKDKVAASVKRQKAETVALERAKQIMMDAKTGDISAAAQKAGAVTGEPLRFSRAKPAPKLPGDAMVAALLLAAGGVTAPVKTPQGYYVLKVLERFPPDMTQLAADRDKIAQELLGKKQGQAWQNWITVARSGAKVDVTAGRPPQRRG